MLSVFSGCSAVPARIHPVSQAAISVLSAATSNARAMRSSAAVQSSITTARAQTAQLAATASEAQKPVVAQIEADLDAANKMVVETQADLDQTNQALNKSTAQIGDLQMQLTDLSDAKDASDKLANKEKASAGFWRSVTWKLTLLSLGMGLWIFRKPLLALCGVPTALPI